MEKYFRIIFVAITFINCIAPTFSAKAMNYENPKNIIITQPGEASRITTSPHISILGACDYRYPLYLNGQKLPTTENGFFTAYVELQEGDNAFIFKNDHITERLVITRKPSAPNAEPELARYYDTPAYGVVKSHYVTHRANPDLSPELLTPLAKGTTLGIIGEINGYYITQEETYIYKSSIDLFQGEMPKATISAIEILEGDGITYLTLEMNVNSLYNLERTENGVSLRIQGVSECEPDLPEGTIIENIVKESGNGLVVYDIYFNREPAGYYAEFKDGKMIVGFKHASKDLKSARVILDPGHGGEDNGAYGPPADFGPVEKDFNLRVAMQAKKYLESRGVKVLLTRDNDSAVPLARRVSKILEEKPDLSVSIHTNSMPEASDFSLATGPLMFYSFGNSEKAAADINGFFAEDTGLTSQEPIKENLAMTRITNCPAILFEMGFMCNPEEYELLMRKGTLEWIGEALGRGIEKHLNLWTEENSRQDSSLWLRGAIKNNSF